MVLTFSSSMYLALFLPLLMYTRAAKSGFHSLKTTIMVNNNAQDIPSYVSYWFLDEAPVITYDSNQKKVIFLKEYLNETLHPQHWQNILDRILLQYNWHSNTFAEVMSNTNKTQGIHFFQAVLGCEVKDDGTSNGFLFYGFDGESFMSFDERNSQWTCTTKQAERMTQLWNTDVFKGKRCSLFLGELCYEYLKMLLSYKQQSAEKQFIPNVKVYGRKSHNHTLISVSCHANGFYPYIITLDLFKNGNLRVNAFQSSGILPNGDGTYQITKTIKVTVDDENRYACHIDHESLEDGITVNWDGKIDDGDGGARGRYIMYIAIAIIVVVILILSAFLFRKKKAGKFTAVSGHEAHTSQRDASPSKGKDTKPLVVTDDALNGYCTI